MRSSPLDGGLRAVEGKVDWQFLALLQKQTECSFSVLFGPRCFSFIYGKTGVRLFDSLEIVIDVGLGIVAEIFHLLVEVDDMLTVGTSGSLGHSR